MSNTETETQETERIVVEVVPLEGCDPVIGTALWVLKDSRRRTLNELKGVPDEWLDIAPPMGHNTIATILHHMASADVDWLHTVLQREMPAELRALYPEDDRDEQGILAVLKGSSLETYLERLANAQNLFVDEYKKMSAEEFRRPRAITYWTGETHWITPERVLYHLVNHDAEHRGELVMIVAHFRETIQTQGEG